ncbi:MAG: hypothetical protein SZ59_C0004G0030 [candidate division TM6 bacterium GW2011_GWF2_28_16]|nr:MAG: hypothetical protein SZ59_C0004G0030 [candidate division TM6 bacterium GW2011_GWF2_28_16]
MKKNILLLLVLSLFAANISAYTNKTYMRPQDSSTYLPDRFRVNDYYKADFKMPSLIGKLDITAYHFHSISKDKMGRYFGVNEKSEFNFIGDQTNDDMDIDYRYLISNYSAHTNYSAKMSLDPKTQYAGFNASVILDLSRINKHLAFKINVPYQRVHTDLRSNFSSSNASLIKDYLAGDYSLNVAAGTRNQEALRYAKITDQQEKLGIPFMDFCLAYNTHNEDGLINTVKLGFISTVEKKATAEYLFEPILGNNNHFGIDVGIEGSKRLFDGNGHRSFVDFVWDLNYKYLFSNTQFRTLGIKGANWGQYYLLGKEGVSGAFIPAANVLTQNVKVEPGSHLDLNLELLFGYHASRVSVGGNIIARQEEELDFKNNLATQTYGVVTPGTSSAVNFDLSTNVGLGNYTTYALSNDNIDLKAAQAPGIFAYKVYLQYAYDYVKRNTERMFTVATGVSLNITDQNAHFDGIGCWFKMAAYF